MELNKLKTDLRTKMGSVDSFETFEKKIKGVKIMLLTLRRYCVKAIAKRSHFETSSLEIPRMKIKVAANSKSIFAVN